MIAKQAEARLWQLLEKVRELRVRRRKIALEQAERKSREAAAEVTARTRTLDDHAQQRPLVLRGCAHGDKAAAVWRQALSHHHTRAAQLERELGESLAREAAAHAQVRAARMALRREMLSHADAGARSAQLDRALREDE